MIRYAITNGDEAPGYAARLAADGVDFLQLRNKTLGAAALAEHARFILEELTGTKARLLINGRADLALATGAAGVHLSARPDELTVAQVRTIFPRAIVSVSCHTAEEATRARDAGADLILFAPVFEKRLGGEVVVPGLGLNVLRQVCSAVAPAKVVALGGVTSENAEACVQAGAAGVAGIRMFY